MDLKESQTFKNLYTAFTGEVQAHAKYLFFEQYAKDEGYEQIAEIFKYTAENELTHAKVWFEKMNLKDDTLNNLENARSGENFEHSKMYKEFEAVARNEGFTQIANLFNLVAKVELHHEKRYEALLNNVENDEVFSKDKEIKWECRNCGYIHEGKDAPSVCPLCKEEQAYFQEYAENFK